MAKNEITCNNCGRTVKNITTAKNDGWLMDFAKDGIYFCCCVCKAEYDRKKSSRKRK